MYARFVTMVLNDLGFLSFSEPFPKFYAHGLMIKDGAKMSKSRGNVINPDEYVKKFGADALRLYQMFIGAMDGYPDFRDSGMEGAARFLGRVWRLFQMTNDTRQASAGNSQMTNGEVLSKLNLTIKGVTEDIEGFKYNTAIAKIMQLVNSFIEYKVTDVESLRTLALLLAPFAPHMMEEVWVETLGQPFSIHKASWPVYEAKYTVRSGATIVIQINGKLRGQVEVNNQIAQDKSKIEKMAMEDLNVAKWLGGKKIKMTIFVPGKLINFVI